MRLLRVVLSKVSTFPENENLNLQCSYRLFLRSTMDDCLKALLSILTTKRLFLNRTALDSSMPIPISSALLLQEVFEGFGSSLKACFTCVLLKFSGRVSFCVRCSISCVTSFSIFSLFEVNSLPSLSSPHLLELYHTAVISNSESLLLLLLLTLLLLSLTSFLFS